MSKRKGDAAERALANYAEDEAGWYAQRTGSSGSATDRARPDVIALKADRRYDGRLWTRAVAFEVKAWADGTGHLDSHEVEELIELAMRAGARPVVAVKPDLRSHDQWHCFGARELHETDGGNFSVRTVDLPGQSLEEVFWSR